MDISPIFSIIILILSVIIHEVAHGYAALAQGDETAKYAGRLTLNPLPHIDPIGSVIVPIIMLIGSGGTMAFGWAKPVPFNPYNLKSQRWGELIVAIAGPLSNLAIALIFGTLIRFSPVLGLPDAMVEISFIIVLMNVVLAVFNLVPFPPLDGSKILFALLPPVTSQRIRATLERYSIVLVLLLIFFLWKFIAPVVLIITSLFTGIGWF